MAFHPRGLTGGRWAWPFAGRIDRVMVISPFASPDVLERLTAKGRNHVLFTRAETADKVGPRAFELFDRVWSWPNGR